MVGIEGEGDHSYKTNAKLSACNVVYLDTSGYIQLQTNAGAFLSLGILQNSADGTVLPADHYADCTVKEYGHSACWVDNSNIVPGSPLKMSATSGALGLGTINSDVIVAIAMQTNNQTACILEVALTGRQK